MTKRRKLQAFAEIFNVAVALVLNRRPNKVSVTDAITKLPNGCKHLFPWW